MRAFSCVAFAVFAFLAAQPARAAGPLDGRWQGVVTFDKEAFLAETSTPAAGTTFRIEIDDSIVRVFVLKNGGLVETKPGLFHIAAAATNAVIYANEATPEANGWVESRVFVVTPKDDDTLIVQYVRVVNNRGLPGSDPQARFATRGAGAFGRVKSL
ncbi:MAG TPA: hypothetical protein VGC36_06515 [Rhizomicrobium sp.]